LNNYGATENSKSFGTWFDASVHGVGHLIGGAMADTILDENAM
jgi:hypothetical protein